MKFYYYLFNFYFQSKSVAEQIAEKLNMKLNYIKQENSHDQDSENFKVYEEELEINDFPQQARWKITSKVIIVFYFNILYFTFFKI